MIESPFSCNRCGLCCKKVNLSPYTLYLDRGDGVCCHFDEATNLCQIYDERPIVCQVQKYYQTYLRDKISWDDFIALNTSICSELQQNCSYI